MKKQKYYVVWIGREVGIFKTWEECKAQIVEFPKAEYKSFKTLALAEEAFFSLSEDFIGKSFFESELTEEQKKLIGEPIFESISVDGAWNTATGVHTGTKEKLFHYGPCEDGTNNIVEFLGIVHALAYCKQKGLNYSIYSDSRNAIKWVRDKEARTNLEKSNKNKKLFELIDRALKWLNENEYQNKVLKWETRAWGENPADFGRK